MLARKGLALACAIFIGLIFLSLAPFHHQVSSYAYDRATHLRDNFSKVWQQDGRARDDFEEASPQMEDAHLKIVPSQTAAPKAASVPLEEADPVALDWRQHLEQFHSGSDSSASLSNLGFSHVYVLSDKNATAQRTRMTRLAEAVGFDVTFLDRMDRSDSRLLWIGERVRETRQEKAKLIAQESNKTVNRIGGLQSGSVWLHPSLKWPKLSLPSHATSNHWHWQHPLRKPRYGTVRFPSLEDERFDGFNWVAYLLYPGSSCDADNPQFNFATELRDPRESDERFQVTRDTIAEWWDFLNLLMTIDRNHDTNVLILKDSIDIEFEFPRIWASILKYLPKQTTANFTSWDLVHLGYESQLEQTHPHYIHPFLHSALEPLNMTAFAMSKSGWKSLLDILSDPWLAFQTRLDVALATLSRTYFVGEGRYSTSLNAFSVVPPLAVELSGPDAAWASSSSNRSHHAHMSTTLQLADSTMERIWARDGVGSGERIAAPRAKTGFSHLQLAKPPTV